MRVGTIQQIVKEHGVKGFCDSYTRALEGKALANGNTVKLNPYEESFQSLYEGLVGPVNKSDPIVMEAGLLEPSGFPTVAEKLISTVTIAGYEGRRRVADTLVPRTYSPKTLTERIPGFTTLTSGKTLVPGEEYPQADFADKFAGFEEALHNKKEGVSIDLTEEVVRFDQTNEILMKAEGVGMTIQEERERRTVRALLGIGLDTGTALSGVYFPSGTDTALYRAAVNNLRTDATPIFTMAGQPSNSQLWDHTDFQEILTVHARNITDDRQTGSGRPISWMPDTVLIPVSLITIAAQVFNATSTVVIPSFTAGTNPERRTQGPNPMAQMMSMFGMNSVPMPIASQYVDEVSATNWVVYDRQKSFIRVEIFPFQVFRSPMGYGWKRDVLVSFKAREWSRCIALDYRHAIKSDGA